MSTRKMKRFATIAAIAMIASCVAMPMTTAFAADPVTDITIKEGTSADAPVSTSAFNAYRILDASIGDSTYSYMVNSKYKSLLQTVMNDADATDDEIKNYIAGLSTDAAVRKFAEDVYAEIRTANMEATAAGTEIPYPADAEATAGKFDDVAQGYYLIAQATKADAEATYSLVILDTTGKESVELNTKKEEPTFEKKIMDKNDSIVYDETNKEEWQDTADYDFGDAVPFRLDATLPGDYANYKQYKLVFHDDLDSNGGTGDAFDLSTLTITNVYYDANGNGQCDTGETLAYTKAVNGTENDTVHEDCDFEITIANLKGQELTENVTGGHVYVEYTVELTETADLGNTGNWNTAYMEYSNNPYYDSLGDGSENDADDNYDNDGDGEIDETDETGDSTNESAKDTTGVFTYQLKVDKKDGSAEGNPALVGAGFTLYKYNASSAAADKFEKVEEIHTDGATTFTFDGIDDGIYKLVETKKPAGYNAIDPMYFVVKAEHMEDITNVVDLTTALETFNAYECNETGVIKTTTDEETGLPTNVNFGSVTLSSGLIQNTVLNETGTKLPSTGGIGTTIFYVVGGTMAAGAGVYLISKKRMKKEEE